MPNNCINMHYFYNVSYFEKLKGKKLCEIKNVGFDEENKAILEYQYADSKDSHETIKTGIENCFSFTLCTTYPGLLIGTGNPHDIASATGMKLGFSFDYVTGLPVIPGSSVKGVLRSYFPQKGKMNYSEKEIFIQELTNKKSLDMEELVAHIFEGSDIFLDAYPIVEKGKEKILKKDNITPHSNPIKNPIPITTLKVRSNIKYEFLFALHDYVPSKNGKDSLTAEEKLLLFKKILLIGGVGGKTNVGFGQFTENCVEEVEKCLSKPSTQIECYSVIECTIKKVFDDKKSAALEYNGIKGKGFDLVNPKVGDKVKIKVTKIKDDGYFLGGSCK